MNENGDIIIRTARVSDLEKLKTFFIKAYGEKTVFQNEKFLLSYFDPHDESLEPLSYSLVGEDANGGIVSHYGGLHYRLKLNDKIISVIWGVNAFTLPECRGKGINSKIVRYIVDNNVANAVMGMQPEVPLFYQKYGYNMFNLERLSRFVYILDPSVVDIVNHLGQDSGTAKKLLGIVKKVPVIVDSRQIVELSADNFEDFDFDLDAGSVCTTYRDANFLSWRVFKNPFITYKVFGYLKNNKIVSYIVIREEILEPMGFKVNRIVDLFGSTEGMMDLLGLTINMSMSDGAVYIDFSVYGKLYDDELLQSGFEKLEGDDVSILPMVSSPVQNRPNNEYIGIQSKVHHAEVHDLSIENVYFTRIDGDRDRIARLTQLR